LSVTFAVCPCDIERDLEFWQEVHQSLDKDYKEEEDFLRETPSELWPKIYFASPDITLELFNKKYIPIARLKKDFDEIILIKLKNNHKKPPWRIAVSKRKFLTVGILLSSLIPEKIELLFTYSHTDCLRYLLEHRADIACLYDRFYEKLTPKEREPFSLYETIPVPFYHYLMVSQDFYQSQKNKLKKICHIPYFTKVSVKEIEKLQAVYQKIDFLITSHQRKNLLENLLEHPGILIVIYRENFLYINKAGLELLGYTQEEFLKLKPEDLVCPEDKKKIRAIIKRRLKGEKFKMVYESLAIKTKDGRLLNLLLFSETIIYEGQYAGLLIGIDITRERQLETHLHILCSVNDLIIRVDKEQELFEKICQTLVEKFKLKLAWIGKIDPSKKEYLVLQAYGEEKGFFKNNYSSFFNFLKRQPHSPVPLTLNTGEIPIVGNTQEQPFPENIKKEFQRRGFLSCATIPLSKGGKIYGVLVLYSPQAHFFTEELKPILKEISQDISFALDKIELLKEYQLLHQVMEASNEWVVITDEKGTILYVTPYVSKLSGYTREEIVGQNPRIFKSGYHSQEFYEILWKTILSGKTFNTIIVNKSKSGKLFKLEEAIHPVSLPGGEKRFIAIGKDVTKEEHLLREIEYFKFFDPLTEVYNLTSFIFKVNEEIKNNNALSVMILLDLKNLSYIN